MLSNFNIIMLGDCGVGKTSIITQYREQTFSTNCSVTIGIDTVQVKYKSPKNTLYRANLWDTAGQERFDSITNKYYSQAHAAIIVFDLSKEDALSSINKWLERIALHGQEDVFKVLVGNKVDLEIRNNGIRSP